MSDGRSRLVSAAAGIAVLAIGVVLGSGPLRAALLGDTGERIDALETQVSEEQDRVAAAEAQARAARDYVDATAPTLLISLLPDTPVLVVTVPGSSTEALTSVESRLPLAGAIEAGPVAVADSWQDTATAEFRTALAEQLAPTLVGVDVTDPAEVLAHAFVQGATGAVPTDGTSASPDATGSDRGAVLWELLEQSGLVTGERAERADAVVLVAGDADTTAALVAAFAAYPAPVTVVGSPAQAARITRADVASVASSDWVIGSITAVATVHETLGGARPQYRDGEVPGVLGVS